MKFHDINHEYNYRLQMLRYHEGFLNGVSVLSIGTDDNAELLANAKALYDQALADFNDAQARKMALCVPRAQVTL